MKKLLTVVLALCIASTSFGNAAMPGLYNPGLGSQFYPLLKEDSIYFGKIKMQKELVLINLYPGFAAVKGEYWMYNTTSEPITMTVGYPVNGSYPQQVVKNLVFNDLYQLNVLVNDGKVSVANINDSSVYKMHKDLGRPLKEMKARGWYFWETTFAPKALTKITVYFLTNNNDANMRQGYNTQKQNAFAYILETGRAWGGSIDTGAVYIQLNNGLTLKDLPGILPANSLSGDDTHLQYTFTNLEPMPENNILIWYEANEEKEFNFGEIQSKAKRYFSFLDRFEIDQFNKSTFAVINKNDFTIPDKAGNMFLAVLIGAGLLVLAIVVAFVYLVVKLVQKRRTQQV